MFSQKRRKCERMFKYLSRSDRFGQRQSDGSRKGRLRLLLGCKPLKVRDPISPSLCCRSTRHGTLGISAGRAGGPLVKQMWTEVASSFPEAKFWCSWS